MKLSNVYIILVEPSVPENIGAVGRAMKNMGLSKLRLVNPVDYKTKQAFALARKGKPILLRAKVFTTINEAVKDLDFVIGTTSKARVDKINHFTVAETAQKIAALSKNKVGILFGRERIGLMNDELKFCNIVSRIPQPKGNFSLNIAQAVMIYCYEIYLKRNDKVASWDLAQVKDMQKMYNHLEEMLKKTTFKASGGIPKFVHRFRRIFGRTPLENRDVRLLHKLFSIMEYHLEKKD